MGVHPGRNAGRLDGDFVVFLIGMRVNRPLRLREWVPVFTAMPRMLRELERRPETGFLGATLGLWTTGPSVTQYWRSFEDLERYARDADAEHLPAWRRFNQRARESGSVGIWHETYKVRAGEYEAIYGNMPRIGLGRAGDHRPLGSTSTAAERVGAGRPAGTPAAP